MGYQLQRDPLCFSWCCTVLLVTDQYFIPADTAGNSGPSCYVVVPVAGTACRLVHTKLTSKCGSKYYTYYKGSAWVPAGTHAPDKKICPSAKSCD